MDVLSLLFLLALNVLVVTVPITALVLLVNALEKSPYRTTIQKYLLLIVGGAAICVGIYWLTVLGRAPDTYDETDIAGTYQVASAPESLDPGTYAQYQLILNDNSTYRVTNRLNFVDICRGGTFSVENLPDDVYLIAFVCGQVSWHVPINPNGAKRQIIFNADQPNAVVFDQIDLPVID